MKKRVGFQWVLAAAVAVAVTAGSACAQGQGGGRSGMNPFGQDMMGRLLCDVEGLWFSATFEAKLDGPTLDKLKPICQKAADARAKELGASEMGDRVQRAKTVKGIGDEMEKAAKEALGANASKLDSWFKKRDEAMKFIEERLSSSASRGPQPTPVPSNPSAAPAPAPESTAPAGETKKEEKK